MTPFPLTRTLAGRSASGLGAVALVPGIPIVRPKPTPTVATLSTSLRTHRISPVRYRKNTSWRHQCEVCENPVQGGRHL